MTDKATSLGARRGNQEGHGSLLCHLGLKLPPSRVALKDKRAIKFQAEEEARRAAKLAEEEEKRKADKQVGDQPSNHDR